MLLKDQFAICKVVVKVMQTFRFFRCCRHGFALKSDINHQERNRNRFAAQIFQAQKRKNRYRPINFMSQFLFSQ